MHISTRIERYCSKVKVFLNAWTADFQMVWLKKKYSIEKMVLCGTLLSCVSAVRFAGKVAFLDGVLLILD